MRNCVRRRRRAPATRNMRSCWRPFKSCLARFKLKVGGRERSDRGRLRAYDLVGIELSAEEQILVRRGEIPDSVPALDGMPFPEPPSASNTGIPS